MVDWLDRWKKGTTGWHRSDINPQLIENINQLAEARTQKIFVPLCGASLDMKYLIDQGFHVVGVELSSLAIDRFFNENKIKHKVSKVEDFDFYQGKNIDIYCGDFFKFKKNYLYDASCVYDRAALIALNPDLQKKYVVHLKEILPNSSKILLLTMFYPQNEMEGPPFSVGDDNVEELFSEFKEIKKISSVNEKESSLKPDDLNLTYLFKNVYLIDL
jgi:thiopurine S-methyltransferase